MTDRLDRHALHWIISTYDVMQIECVHDVPTLLFDVFAFTEEDVRDAIGLGPDDNTMEGLSAYLEDNHGFREIALSDIVR